MDRTSRPELPRGEGKLSDPGHNLQVGSNLTISKGYSSLLVPGRGKRKSYSSLPCRPEQRAAVWRRSALFQYVAAIKRGRRLLIVIISATRARHATGSDRGRDRV